MWATWTVSSSSRRSMLVNLKRRYLSSRCFSLVVFKTTCEGYSCVFGSDGFRWQRRAPCSSVPAQTSQPTTTASWSELSFSFNFIRGSFSPQLLFYFLFLKQPRLQRGVLQKVHAGDERPGQQRYPHITWSFRHFWCFQRTKLKIKNIPPSCSEPREQDVFGCWYSSDRERHCWIPGPSHRHQKGAFLSKIQPKAFNSFVLKLMIFLHEDNDYVSSSCREWLNATSANPNPPRRPSQDAR